MDGTTIHERTPNVATDKEVLFSLRDTPLLEQGTSYDPLATAENLWVNLKVYASGGENALHSHAGEDHAFVIMQGKATFTFDDGRTQIVGQYEGVMLPKNAKYKFEADEAENLVMLRVGGGVRDADRLLPGVGRPHGTGNDHGMVGCGSGSVVSGLLDPVLLCSDPAHRSGENGDAEQSATGRKHFNRVFPVR